MVLQIIPPVSVASSNADWVRFAACSNARNVNSSELQSDALVGFLSMFGNKINV